MKKKALIFGVTGQDGAYLSEFLINKNYIVHGVKRRSSSYNTSRIDHIIDSVNTYYGDLMDWCSLERVVKECNPTHIFNLGAMSHVRVSSDVPSFTIKTNAEGVLNLLEVYRNHCPDAKFYQASSSEMFGLSVEDDNFQRETTIMNPVSPYGCSKVFGYNIVRN